MVHYSDSNKLKHWNTASSDHLRGNLVWFLLVYFSAGTEAFYCFSYHAVSTVSQTNCNTNLGSVIDYNYYSFAHKYYSYMVIQKLTQVLKNLICISHITIGMYIV